MFARRCLIRDVVVQVPAPATIIANFVHPSHVVVQRCTGQSFRALLFKSPPNVDLTKLFCQPNFFANQTFLPGTAFVKKTKKIAVQFHQHYAPNFDEICHIILREL